MIQTTDPLFGSSHQALKFALRFSHGNFEQSVVSKMALKSTHGGRGLGGLDGAAQAGIVRDMVAREISELQMAILVARCAARFTPCGCGAACCSRKKRNMEWEQAISVITRASIGEFSGIVCKTRLCAAIIKHHFGERSDEQREDREWAKRFEVSRDDVAMYKSKIRRWLYGDDPKKVKEGARKGEEIRAWELAEALLMEKGVVGELALA